MQAEATTPVTAPITEQVTEPVQPNTVNYESDRCKVYKYKKNNGKFITVKRSWKNIGEKETINSSTITSKMMLISIVRSQFKHYTRTITVNKRLKSLIRCSIRGMLSTLVQRITKF